MMNAIRCHNVVEAENSLRNFFDWTTIRVNEIISIGKALTAIDRRPLRYAPLLHARLARIFGQKVHARHLLTEAVHQAQCNHDLVCLRLSLVEHALIDTLDAQDKEADEYRESKELLTSVYKFSPTLLLTLVVPETMKEECAEVDMDEEFRIDTQEIMAFTKQIRDYTLLQNCIDSAKMGRDQAALANAVQICAGADYGLDRQSQTRTLNEAARVVGATVKLANGFVESARNDCSMLLHYNPGDQWCERYDTESHVIAAVNIAYAQALSGRFSEAINLIHQMKSRFTTENNWQCAWHWKCCESLIEFDRAFFTGDWMVAEQWLNVMIGLAPLEAGLRRAVFYFSQGDLEEAIDVARNCLDKAKSLTDIRLRFRCEIVLAMFNASNRLTHVATRALGQCRSLAKSHELDLFEAIILRRIAYIDAIDNRFDEALKKLAECDWTIRTRSSLLENALYHLTLYTIYANRQSNRPDGEAHEIQVNALATARQMLRRGAMPLLEKGVLAEAVQMFERVGQIDKRDECIAIFCELNNRYPGSIDWTVL